MANVRDALNSATSHLRQRPDLAGWAVRDANLLLQHLLQVSRAYLLAHGDRELTPQENASYSALLDRRLQAEPMQYILGVQEFYGREFVVNPSVLIPRPETEQIIDLARQRFQAKESFRLLDVGTGSGVLAVTLALGFPHAAVTAVDISADALHVARTNATRLGAGRVRFLESDLCAAVEEETFDLIVSNPPYIAEADRDTMHEQVRKHEPSLALFAGHDGNAVYRRLIPQAWSHLASGGWLMLEQGTQGDALKPLLSGWDAVALHQDLQGIDRIITARRS